MIIQRKTANVVGGKTARPCDGCLRRRARWYCTADDAFLCQTCDSSVHSANLLASRHERVRLEKLPFSKTAGSRLTNIEPAWHQGFTRKARTPRPTKRLEKPSKNGQGEKILNPLALVPEINSDESSPHEDEELLLYRVPIFDPFLCDVPNEIENNFSNSMYDEACELDAIQTFDLPSDMDLADFAADVENLLGGGLDHSVPCGINDLGFFNSKEEEENIAIFDDCIFEDRKLVKVENGIMNWKCDFAVGEEEEKAAMDDDSKEENIERKKFLKLDYEGVMSAWDYKGCPWTNGIRPDINSNDCWPEFMVSPLEGSSKQWIGGQSRCGDVGREARVTRYREKRRTRLFSKKIRYQVRKINAEKRPRMKGRFVKRSTSLSSTSPIAPNNSYHLFSTK